MVEVHECIRCGECFTRNSSLKRHLTEKINICEAEFINVDVHEYIKNSDKYKLEYIKLRYNGENINKGCFKCDICDMSYSTKKSFNSHKKNLCKIMEEIKNKKELLVEKSHDAIYQQIIHSQVNNNINNIVNNPVYNSNVIFNLTNNVVVNYNEENLDIFDNNMLLLYLVELDIDKVISSFCVLLNINIEENRNLFFENDNLHVYRNKWIPFSDLALNQMLNFVFQNKLDKIEEICNKNNVKPEIKANMLEKINKIKCCVENEKKIHKENITKEFKRYNGFISETYEKVKDQTEESVKKNQKQQIQQIMQQPFQELVKQQPIQEFVQEQKQQIPQQLQEQKQQQIQQQLQEQVEKSLNKYKNEIESDIKTALKKRKSKIITTPSTVSTAVSPNFSSNNSMDSTPLPSPEIKRRQRELEELDRFFETERKIDDTPTYESCGEYSE